MTGLLLSQLGCSSAPKPSRQFASAKAKVHNRGRAPDDFLNLLVDWAQDAPDEIFAVNPHFDIYSVVAPQLGPWRNLTHRKAAMLEVLRVLGGFESSWDWQAGRDTTNPSSNTACTMEAGIFQCSGDSMYFDASLKQLLYQARGSSDCDTFRDETQRNPRFAIEYCARLLRFTVKHHGPIKRREINPWLSKEAMAEFERYL
ncbi:hypothetical protein [Aliagarivorans taiwanensis]|uniref:hypothetical protein n=1 Tax=Aliagarivorans taiwanensis TaxID=561966 RepID=UPI0004242988|nr:hypothetical protein [Aliagarivorans taiwanensis]